MNDQFAIAMATLANSEENRERKIGSVHISCKCDFNTPIKNIYTVFVRRSLALKIKKLLNLCRPPLPRLTDKQDSTQNITFRQLRWWAVINKVLKED